MALVLLVAAFAASCGSDGTTGPGGNNQGGFTITLSANALTVAQSGNGTITITVTRTGTFTGAVTLSAGGLATGVTAAFDPATIAAGQNSSTLTLSAGSTSAAGNSTLTVTGSASGVQGQSANVQVTVTAAPQAGPFTMALTVSSYQALPPTILSAMPVLSVQRTGGFTGPIALSVSGIPPGLVVGVTPTNLTGNQANVGIIDGGAANGTYSVTIRGTGGGGERSVTFQVVVAPPTTGATTWEFCSNGATSPQWFFALKDGGGPWTRIVPTTTARGVSYSFNVAGPSAQVAMVTSDSGGYRTTYYQYTADELRARAAAECTLNPQPSQRTVTGNLTGHVAGEFATVGMGYWTGSAINPGGATPVVPYTLLNLPSGPLDIVAFKHGNAGFLPLVNRGLIRRGVNPPAGGTNAVVDLSSAESFALTSSTWTFNNTNGEEFGLTQMYRTAGNSVGILHAPPGLDVPGDVRSVFGVPAAQTQPGDLQVVIATVRTSVWPRALRQIIAYHRTLTDRTLEFGPAMTAPAVSSVPGAPVLIRAEGTLPAAYNAGFQLDITQSPIIARYATILATRGFLGSGSGYDVQMTDLSGAIGWDINFAIRRGIAATWVASGGGPVMDFFDNRNVFNAVQTRWTGALTGVVAPVDGATYVLARTVGMITP
jgi:hypothetical protein